MVRDLVELDMSVEGRKSAMIATAVLKGAYTVYHSDCTAVSRDPIFCFAFRKCSIW